MLLPVALLTGDHRYRQDILGQRLHNQTLGRHVSLPSEVHLIVGVYVEVGYADFYSFATTRPRRELTILEANCFISEDIGKHTTP